MSLFDDEDELPVTPTVAEDVRTIIERSGGNYRRAQEMFWLERAVVFPSPVCPGYGPTRGTCRQICKQITSEGLVGGVYFAWGCPWCMGEARKAEDLARARMPLPEDEPRRRRGTR